METVSIRNPGMTWDIAQHPLPSGFDAARHYPPSCPTTRLAAARSKRQATSMARPWRSGLRRHRARRQLQGGSGGSPRWLEDAEQRVRDYRDVIDYLQRLPYVDPDRIGILGICGAAAIRSRRPSSTNGSRPWSPSPASASVDCSRRVQRLQSGGHVGSHGCTTRPRTPAASRASTSSCRERGSWAAGINDIDVLEATDYRNRQPNANAGTRMLFSHAVTNIAWDAFAFAETLLTQPMMVVIGDKPGGFGAYRDGMEIHGRAASKDKAPRRGRRLVSL